MLWQVFEPVFEIVLNSLELELDNVRLMDDKTGQEIAVSEVVLNAESERAEFKFPSLLQPGQYNLRLTFKGVVTDKLKGLYYSKYLE